MEIPLKDGLVAVVDEEDADLVTGYHWMAWKGPRDATWYVVANGPRSRSTESKRIYLHRLIASPDVEAKVDHRDGDGLNNRRGNLRICMQKGNARNRRKRKPSSSRFKGVSLYKRTGKWQASIQVDGKRMGLGYYECEEDAARAYDVAARQHFGEFGATNEEMGLLCQSS